MGKQAYILKKYVHAENAAEAILLDDITNVDEVILVEDKPIDFSTQAVGFQVITPEDDD